MAGKFGLTLWAAEVVDTRMIHLHAILRLLVVELIIAGGLRGPESQSLLIEFFVSCSVSPWRRLLPNSQISEWPLLFESLTFSMNRVALGGNFQRAVIRNLGRPPVLSN